LLAHGRWFSLGTPASSTAKTGRHDIAEILLKVALNTKDQSINQSINQSIIKCGGRLTICVNVYFYFYTVDLQRDMHYADFVVCKRQPLCTG
jgi:hypothetical protein